MLLALRLFSLNGRAVETWSFCPVRLPVTARHRRDVSRLQQIPKLERTKRKLDTQDICAKGRFCFPGVAASAHAQRRIL